MAKTELSQLQDLWEEVRWYQSEVAAFRNWTKPWYTSFPGSLVELFAHIHTPAGSFGHVYYSGSIDQAPLLPSEIVYIELENARKQCNEAFLQLSAASDWAPGGWRYEEMLRTSDGVRAYNLLSEESKEHAECSGALGVDGSGLQQRLVLGGPSEASEEAPTSDILG